MTAEQKGSRGSNILAEIQSRRFQRFTSVCTRFSAPIDLTRGRRERELKRLDMLEKRRVRQMYSALGASLGMTGEEYRAAVEATFIDQQ